MKLIVKDNQKGTVALIYTSETTGYSIITAKASKVAEIKKLAEELQCNIPPVYTVEEVKNKLAVDRTVGTKYLLDDCQFVIEEAIQSYLGCEIFAANLDYDQIPKDHGVQIGIAYNTVLQEGDYADNITSARLSGGLDIDDDSDIDILLSERGI